MKRKVRYVSVVVFVLLLTSLFVSLVSAEDTGEYAWVLQEVLQTTPNTPSITPDEPFPAEVYEHTDHYTTRVELHETRAEIRRTAPGSSSGHRPMDIHVVYRWTPPVEVIRPDDTVTIPVDIDIINDETGGYGTTFSVSARLGQHWPMSIIAPTNWQSLEYITVGAPYSSRTAERAVHLQDSAEIMFAREAWSAGRPGREQTIRFSLPRGTLIDYVYQWAPVPEERKGYSAWQPESTEQELSEQFLSFFEEVEALVRLGEEYRAASPDYLKDFNELLDEYRPEQ